MIDKYQTEENKAYSNVSQAAANPSSGMIFRLTENG